MRPDTTAPDCNLGPITARLGARDRRSPGNAKRRTSPLSRARAPSARPPASTGFQLPPGHRGRRTARLSDQSAGQPVPWETCPRLDGPASHLTGAIGSSAAPDLDPAGTIAAATGGPFG